MRYQPHPFLSLFLFGLGALNPSFAHAAERPAGRLLDPAMHHLGNDVVKNWPEAPANPEGFSVEIAFEARANAAEVVLGLTHRDVDDHWVLSLNGREVARTRKEKALGEYLYPVPAGALRDGPNTFRIHHDRTKDDITIGKPVLYPATFRAMLGLKPLRVTVSDAATGTAVPARLTLTDSKGALQEVYYAETEQTAVRSGVVYTTGSGAVMELPPGDYRLYATRGMEWSRDVREVRIGEGQGVSVALMIRREVDTRGFIAADTHIHTLTFSGHGDASYTERMVTLAGEGVELAISTDHNHQTDYSPEQVRLALDRHFTPVTGNEVTTANGHFNAFPLSAGGEVPEYKQDDWVKLVNGIRGKGAKVVILNHPRWPDIARGPFGRFGLNRASGDRAQGGAFTFDAMELINATTLQPDPLYVCRDWFALLNHGERIRVVGSSDSHTVGDPVGQGRTYLRCSTDDPARIPIDEACEAFRQGDATVSLGIFTELSVNGRPAAGQVLSAAGPAVEVDLRVAAPSWVKPRRALIFINGEKVAEQAVPEVASGKPTDTRLRFQLPRPDTDAWLVCVVLGDGVPAPVWGTQEDYTFAATNPVWLDADGDGRYRSPREIARRLLAGARGVDAAWQKLGSVRDPIAVQMLSLMREPLAGGDLAALDQRIREAAKERPFFQEYLRYLPKAK